MIHPPLDGEELRPAIVEAKGRHNRPLSLEELAVIGHWIEDLRGARLARGGVYVPRLRGQFDVHTEAVF